MTDRGDRPMPDHLQDALWSRIRPELVASRRRKPGPPLAVAAAVGVLAVGAAVAFGPGLAAGPDPVAVPAGAGSLALADPGAVKLAKDCVDATLAAGYAVPAPDSWWPAAEINTDTANGFMVVRNDLSAAVCPIDGGQAVGMMSPDVEGMAGRRFGYAKLTADRPFTCIGAIGGLGLPTFEFGIVSTDVTAISLVAMDNSVFPATVRDGTFAVKIGKNTPGRVNADYRARMTMKNGQVIEAPLV